MQSKYLWKCVNISFWNQGFKANFSEISLNWCIRAEIANCMSSLDWDIKLHFGAALLI